MAVPTANPELADLAEHFGMPTHNLGAFPGRPGVILWKKWKFETPTLKLRVGGIFFRPKVDRQPSSWGLAFFGRCRSWGLAVLAMLWAHFRPTLKLRVRPPPLTNLQVEGSSPPPTNPQVRDPYWDKMHFRFLATLSHSYNILCIIITIHSCCDSRGRAAGGCRGLGGGLRHPLLMSALNPTLLCAKIYMT